MGKTAISRHKEAGVNIILVPAKGDNCVSKTEFIEKAVRFYCGYLLQNKPELVSYLAPQICTITDGIIKGSEQRLARAIFKLAVEVGIAK